MPFYAYESKIKHAFEAFSEVLYRLIGGFM